MAVVRFKMISHRVHRGHRVKKITLCVLENLFQT
jgi:hypothetical protein